MKYLLLIALLSFHVNADDSDGVHLAIGICTVMMLQMSPEKLNTEFLKYWEDVADYFGMTLEQYIVSCNHLYSLYIPEEEKDEKTTDRIEL